MSCDRLCSTATLVVAALTAALSASSPRQREDRSDVVEWPNREFPSVQSAIEALPEGGTLRFTETVVRIDEPLFVRGKRIVIEGNGCDEQRTRLKDAGTHLVGPRADTLAEFDAVRAVINFEPSAEGVPGGGTVRNLKISGRDAAVRGAFADDARGGGVRLENVCLTDTHRAVTWSGPVSLALKNVLIRDVLWNAVSMVGVAQSLASAFLFTDVTVISTGNACLFFQNAQATVVGSHFNFCGSSGTIVALDSNLYVADTSIAGSHGPGIAVSGGSTFITETLINQATGFGILLHNVLHGDIEDVHIKDTKSFTSGAQAGLYGDGVTIVGGPANGPAWVTDSFIENAAHSGVASYGGFVSIGDLRIQCTLFHVEGEALGTKNFVYSDLGGMKCGCPTATSACQAVSAVSAAAPAPPTTIP